MKKSSYIVIYFAVFWLVLPGLLLVISIILDKIIFPGTKLPSGCIIPGFILIIPGFFLLLLTIYQFKLFSGEYPVSAYPPEKIIIRGLFAVWRHPVYLFASLTLLGITMILRSAALLLIVFPVFMIFVGLYTIREESILVKRFGNDYVNYRKSVPLLIPHLHQWLKIPGFCFLKIWFRLKILNRENIPASLPFIVISGHRHYFDPLFISYAIPVPVKHISTYEMFRNPFIRKIFTILGVIPRKRYTKDTKGVMKILSTVRSGFPVCIFPEGGRSWTGRLRTFKPESLKLLKHLKNIPVLPVCIEGSYHSWPRWANHLMKSDVTVTIEKPVYIDPDISDEALDNFLRKLVEPGNEIEDKTICRGKNRIECLSRAVYRCPVCLTSHSPIEIPPEKMYCRFCGTTFHLKPDFKVEFNYDGITKAQSIYDLYNFIKIKYSDIYNLLPEVPEDILKDYLKTGEILLYGSSCQLWIEIKSAFKKSINGWCLLSDNSLTISNGREHHSIPLAEIGAVTIESNYKLQIFNDKYNTLNQITFENDSALKWQDILEVILAERFNKQIISR
ncbi:MAG: 1-acyl-sn-glycerol-3-phosphate acyltransferase [Bacteroidales bacterium]|nr:1-acyl-sn-glycerol-3-phosphate acyltransferase [Bacteroidales bacterium]